MTENNGNPMIPAQKETPVDLPLLKRILIKRFASIVIMMILILFLPAWSLLFWPAWLYCATLLIPVFLVGTYLFKHDPELLRRRMKMREKEKEQKLIVKLGFPIFLAAIILPGFDWRFHWSRVPLLLIISAAALVLLSYLFFFRVLQENSYASRIIEVDQRQKVITTGPYSLVRHPMYLAIIIMYLFSPLALASYWSLLPASLIVVILIARIHNEEIVLSKNLPGYREYKQKTRWRLIPGIW